MNHNLNEFFEFPNHNHFFFFNYCKTDPQGHVHCLHRYKFRCLWLDNNCTSWTFNNQSLLSSPLLPTHAHTGVCDHAAPHALNLKTLVDYLFACEKQKKTLRRMEVLKKRQQQVWPTAVMMPILKLGPYINIRFKHPMHQVCLVGVEIWKGGSSSHQTSS